MFNEFNCNLVWEMRGVLCVFILRLLHAVDRTLKSIYQLIRVKKNMARHATSFVYDISGHDFQTMYTSAVTLFNEKTKQKNLLLLTWEIMRLYRFASLADGLCA